MTAVILEDRRIAWIDLETTGLDPMKDDILEVGVIVTDGRFKEIARKNWVLKAHAGQLGAMPQEVVLMHAQSGLWKECLESSLRVEEVNNDLLHFLSVRGCKGAFLAGNSVGDFDRHFMRKYLPKCNSYLSHRSINASTFKALFSMWAPHVKPPAPEKGAAHRSLADCEHSISELKFWISSMHEINGQEVLLPSES